MIEAHAARIEARNGAINAFVDLRLKEALAEADRADSGAGEDRALPLDGVPLALKEEHDIAGLATTLGIRSRQELVPDRDSPVVGRLRAAGGIVLGKTNMPDLAIRWNTISSLHGTTRNPRDLELTAGGSSGGDAAAVASGMAPVGIGSDYGGSIRVPSTFCGVVGLRPTAGVVPNVPVLPPQDFTPSADLMNSIGPIARSIDDLELVFDVIRGPIAADPVVAPAELAPAPGRPGRIALLVGETGAVVDRPVEESVRQTAAVLAGAGYDVVEGAVPDLRRAPELWGEIIATELSQLALPELRDKIGESGLQHIEAMFGLFDLGPSVELYLRAVLERRALARAVYGWMEEYPLVLAPVAGMATPRLDFDHFLTIEQTRELFDHMRCVMWVNLLGLPSVALGNGVQIVGRRFHEREALEAARAARAALGPVEVASHPVGAGSHPARAHP